MKGKKNEIPMWARTGHSKPITRRELLASGLIPFSASMIMPAWTKLLAPQEAHAATCPTPSSDLIPFVTLNLAGGAALSGNFIPHDQGGQLLPNYSLMGLGKAPPVESEFGNVPFAGKKADGTLVSKFLQGVRETAPNAIQKTAFVAVCVRSRDDSAENKFAVDGMLAKAGLVGSLLPNLGRRANTAVGIGQAAATLPPPSPLVVSSFNSLTSSLGYAAAVGNALKPPQKQALAKLISRLSEAQSRKLASMGDVKTLVDCAGVKNEDLIKQGTDAVDPRLDSQAGADLSKIWNVSANTGANSQDLIFGSMVYNALKGQCGSVALELGGYDYHDNTRGNGDNKDLDAGRNAGRILETANALGKPVFLYITSDGSVSSAQSETPDSPWTSDRGTAGVVYMLYYNPAGRPETSAFQVGSFTSGQVADEKFVTGNSPEAAAGAVFANYLSVNRRLDLFGGIAGRALDVNQLNNVIKFG